LNEALDRLEKCDKLKAEVVKLRYFAGLTVPQAAEVIGVSASSVDNYWAYARAWLRIELSSDSTRPDG
jgi:RNA polymerase sigma factor (sigma-70 family)